MRHTDTLQVMVTKTQDTYTYKLSTTILYVYIKIPMKML